MGKKAPSAPTPPDPVALTQAQTQGNLATAQQNAELNRVNQITPFGSLTYRRAGPEFDNGAYLAANPDVAAAVADGRYRSGYEHWTQNGQAEGRDNRSPGYDPANANRWEAVQTLSPAEQRQLDLSNQATEIYGRAAVNQLGRAEQSLSNPFDPNLPALQYGADFRGIGDPNQSREAVQQALLDRLAPLQARDQQAQETQLANQGITLGSEAWRAAVDDRQRGVNDARLAAIAQAGQEQSRMYGLGFQQAGLNNATRQQGLQEALTIRNQPINEAQALLNGSTVQQPNWVNVPQVNVANTDYLGAQQMYQQALNTGYQAKNANYQANLQGMYQLGGAALGAAAGGFGGFGGSSGTSFSAAKFLSGGGANGGPK